MTLNELTMEENNAPVISEESTPVPDIVPHQPSLKRKRLTIQQPRWYNQAYLLFLALRQHPQMSLSRTALTEAAIELDKKISAELQLPRVFRGKTPKNSASATLTNNSDRYFIAYKPEGSKSTHFKLAYEPGNVGDAVKEYNKWCTKLVEHDWPFCFGVSKKQQPLEDDYHSETTSHYHTPISHPEEEDDEDNMSMKQEHTPMNDTPKPELSSETTVQDQEVMNLTQELDTKIYIESISSPSFISTAPTSPTTAPLSTTSTETTEPPVLDPPARKSRARQPIPPPEPFISLDQLDLSNIPQSWHDIVEVAPSKIPGGGNGLFAKRPLPYNTPIGFYFGVPMTEDEFDSLKDRVGRSSEYSIMYRRTVLDATDDAGQPIHDQTSPRFCPFHFMNETSSQKTASIAFVEGAIVNQIICWTKKYIEQGEELLVWYGKDVHRYWTEEEEKEANRKKKEQQKDNKSKKEENKKRIKREKQDRLMKRQERAKFLNENKVRKEQLKKEKVEQDRLKKLKKQQERLEEKQLQKMEEKENRDALVEHGAVDWTLADREKRAKVAAAAASSSYTEIGDEEFIETTTDSEEARSVKEEEEEEEEEETVTSLLPDNNQQVSSSSSSSSSSIMETVVDVKREDQDNETKHLILSQQQQQQLPQ